MRDISPIRTNICSCVLILINLAIFNNAQAELEIRQNDAIETVIQQYESVVKELEVTHGVYHPAISENLMQLGLAYGSLDKYDQAHETFQQALHIHRVNYGLHSKEQLPIVEEIINANIKKNDWDTLNKNYDYLNWVYLREYEHDVEDLIPLLERLANAKLYIVRNLDRSEQLKHLKDTEKLFNRIITLSEGKQGYLENKLNALHGVGLSNYLIASFLDGQESRDLRETARDKQQAIRYYNAKIKSYINGKNAMLRIIREYETNPDLSKESHVIALTHLGDWYLVFNKPLTAKATYQEAHQLIASNNIKQNVIDYLFANPVQLPVYRSLYRSAPESEQQSTETNFIPVSLDVTRTGQTKNIQVIDSNTEKDKKLHRSIKKTLAATRFRPRFEQGKPVKTSDFNIKFPESGIPQ
ncbi:MAG: tetratricopeptide repeat protein [Proteobacteria bacterium]|nr:tetratricopeptide repeat protein [Pseudomonadota bacterium]